VHAGSLFASGRVLLHYGIARCAFFDLQVISALVYPQNANSTQAAAFLACGSDSTTTTPAITATVGGWRMKSITLSVPGPVPPAPSPPPPPGMGCKCPTGFSSHASGYWSNPTPNTTGTKPPISVAACAAKCAGDATCRAFEVFDPEGTMQCHTFEGALRTPFTPCGNMCTCVKSSHSDVH
jgi:hypothetical protein